MMIRLLLIVSTALLTPTCGLLDFFKNIYICSYM